MRTHLGCIGRVNLGSMGEESRNRLEQVGAAWLEFAGDGASLVVRNAQSSDTSVLSNVVSDLLEFLSKLADAERAKVPGGELHCSVEHTGQYVRLKVSPGAFLTVAWAQPDYSRARWVRYHGERIPVVFDAYQRLNGVVAFDRPPAAVDNVRAVAERCGGLHPEGELAARVQGNGVELRLWDVS